MTDDVAEDALAEAAADVHQESPEAPQWKVSRKWSVNKTVVLAIVLIVLATVLGVAHRFDRDPGADDNAIVDAAKSAVNELISPSSEDSAGSVDRIAASATGSWLSDFKATEQQFADAIEQSATESVGDVIEAGIESRNDDGGATVLVAAVSKVTNASGAKDEPRTWRLRVDVELVAGEYKLSKVEVVP